MLSVRQKGRLLGQDKTDVSDGKFDFSVFSKKGLGYDPGTYQASIPLSGSEYTTKRIYRFSWN
jgi:hypothetical protein